MTPTIESISLMITRRYKNIGTYANAFAKGIHKKIADSNFKDSKGNEIMNWNLYISRIIDSVIPDRYK